MNALQRAMNINNFGVGLLENHETSRAVAAFQQGILLVKQCTSASHQPQAVDAAVIHCEVSTQGISQTIPPSHDYEATQTDVTSSKFSYRSGTKIGCIDDGFCYSYNRPILLQSISTVTSSQDFDSQLYLITIILIFNMAMAYQCHAAFMNDSKSLSHVVKVYNLAATMVDNAFLDDVCGTVIMCLIMNNLAHVHSKLCDYEQCRYCLKRVRDSLAWNVEIDFFASQFLHEQDWIELKLNYMYEQTLIPSTSPAA